MKQDSKCKFLKILIKIKYYIKIRLGKRLLKFLIKKPNGYYYIARKVIWFIRRSNKKL